MDANTYDLDAVRALAPDLADFGDEAIREALERIDAMRRAEHHARQQAGIKRKLVSGEGYRAASIGYVNRRIGDRAWIEPEPATYPLVEEAKQFHATGHFS